MLGQLKISEAGLRCAKSLNELRLLNNAVKHDGHIEERLAELPRWKRRAGEEIGDLRSHYHRLRPLAERYIDDLTGKATKWWKSKPA